LRTLRAQGPLLSSIRKDRPIMNHPTAGVQTPRPRALLVPSTWGRTAPYLLAFALPLATTAFLLSGERAVAVAWLGMLVIFAWLDERLAPVPDERDAT